LTEQSKDAFCSEQQSEGKSHHHGNEKNFLPPRKHWLGLARLWFFVLQSISESFVAIASCPIRASHKIKKAVAREDNGLK
jgi:hypothetical protein